MLDSPGTSTTLRPINGFLCCAIVLGFLLNVYFISHLFYGHNSVAVYDKLLLIRDERSTELRLLIDYNESVENSLNLVNDNYVDKDYLDELARLKLNYSSPNEKVIILKD